MFLFYNENCPHCDFIFRMLSTEEKIDNLQLVSVNINPDGKRHHLVGKYGITHVPTIVDDNEKLHVGSMVFWYLERHFSGGEEPSATTTTPIHHGPPHSNVPEIGFGLGFGGAGAGAGAGGLGAGAGAGGDMFSPVGMASLAGSVDTFAGAGGAGGAGGTGAGRKPVSSGRKPVRSKIDSEFENLLNQRSLLDKQNNANVKQM